MFNNFVENFKTLSLEDQARALEEYNNIPVTVGMNDLIKVVPDNLDPQHSTQPIIEITSLIDNETFCFSPEKSAARG